MFSSKHAIWKFARANDELDDWLPYTASKYPTSFTNTLTENLADIQDKIGWT